MQKRNDTQTISAPLLTHFKDSHFQAQLKTVAEAFSVAPATMLMVAHLTGIERANICRHVAELKKSDRIILLSKGLCKISNYMAGFYTTDPGLMPSQLKLF